MEEQDDSLQQCAVEAQRQQAGRKDRRVGKSERTFDGKGEQERQRGTRKKKYNRRFEADVTLLRARGCQDALHVVAPAPQDQEQQDNQQQRRWTG